MKALAKVIENGRADILTRDPSTAGAVVRQSAVLGGNWSSWQNY